MKPKLYCNKFNKHLKNNKTDPDQGEASMPCSSPRYPWALGQYCSSFSHSGTTFTILPYPLNHTIYISETWHFYLDYFKRIACIVASISLWLCCSVAQSCPTLLPHGLQHARQAPLTLLSLRASSDLYPLSWWCGLTISSSAVPFSFCL